MKKNYKLPKGKALMLRTCAADMTSYGGFQWKESGTVIAPYFDPNPVYGRGLHGLLWGQGHTSLLNWAVDAKWLVCEIDAESLIDLGGKIKVKRAKVVYCGERQAALDFLRPHLPAAMPLPGDVVVSGEGGTSTSGYKGTSTSGYRGTLIIRWQDGGRYRTAVAYVGENGIKPNTPYRLDSKGNFVEVQP